MENSFNCYADHLRRHGLLETDMEAEPFNGDSYLCEVILTTTAEAVYKDLFEEFNKTEEFHGAAGCIVDTLKKSNWSDLDIKERVYAVSDFSDEEMTKKIQELKALQSNISSEAIVSCMADKEFGELFDIIYNKEEDTDLVADYCARRFAVTNKLIDTSVYHVEENPHNIKTEDINCDVINKQHFEEAEVELRQHLLKDIHENVYKADCLIRKYHDNHYFNNTLVVALLGEIGITDEQKKIEKKKFIRRMIKITKTLMEC